MSERGLHLGLHHENKMQCFVAWMLSISILL